MQHTALFLFLSVCGLLACGRTQMPTSGGQLGKRDALVRPDGSGAPIAPLADRIAAASKGEVRCDFLGECHPGVAMVSVVQSTGIERCTGFLVGPKTVVTNDHCMSESTFVQEYRGQCRNLVFVHFANPGGEGLSIGCSRVQRSMQTGIGSMDYAVIELDQAVTGRTPFRVSQRGFRNQEKATIIRLQMESQNSRGVFSSVQSKLECAATFRTMLYPAVNSPYHPLMTFGDCAIQLGNSGSPALNEDGEVGAVVQGFLTALSDKPARYDARMVRELPTFLLDDSYGNVAIGTQLFCAAPWSTQRNPCLPIAVIQTEYPSVYLKKFSPKGPAKDLPAAPTGTQWKSTNRFSEWEEVYAQLPECVSPNPGTDRVPLDISFAKFRRGVNSSLVSEWRMIASPDRNRIQIEGKQSTRSSVDFESAQLGRFSLPVCDRTGVRLAGG